MVEASEPESNWRARVGKSAGNVAGDVGARLAGRYLRTSEGESRAPGFWSKFFQTAATTGVERVVGSDEAMEHIESIGSDYLTEQITEGADALINETKPLAKKAADALDPEHKNTYEMFKAKLVNPSDPLIKRMLTGLGARVLSFGTTVASYVSASFVDSLTGRDEWVNNRESFVRIITGAVDKAFPGNAVPAAATS